VSESAIKVALSSDKAISDRMLIAMLAALLQLLNVYWFCCIIQGGPAKVRPTYILMVTFECIDKIQQISVNVITVIQAHTLGSIKV